ncbi:hypothetical protein EVAR_96796_1 [Eumeta japonica]|uniref:Uncharacterized protein n=1 Tax=Eumeta variegata TaxID=151549 RepID=A0A4C1WCK2_EUMVA|nr:hypothetical protein EVAR_96796_1 [Eumeta japonica]
MSHVLTAGGGDGGASSASHIAYSHATQGHEHGTARIRARPRDGHTEHDGRCGGGGPGPGRAGRSPRFINRRARARHLRGRGAAHAPASILVRPPRGYHCNMAATHFLAEVLP